MRKIKRMVTVMTLISLLSAASSAFATDDTIRETFTDAFYGAGIGALIGGALMVFTKHPSDHYNYVVYGAATGVIAGSAYGLTKSARALAEIENGRVKIALPTIIPELVVSPSAGRTEIAWKANLIRGTFN